MARGQSRREDQTIIIRVGHDQGSDQAGGNAPGCGPGVLDLTVLILELDLLGSRKILTEEVRGAGLERLAVLHHGFDGQCRHGARKTFTGRLLSTNDWHRHEVLCEIGIDIEHAACFLHRLLGRGVDGVSLLPKEFRGSEEQSRAHFPADDVGPLIDQDGEIAIGLDPFGIGGSDDRFAGGSYDQRFFKRTGRSQSSFAIRFETVVGDDCALLGEPFDVFRFLFEETHRDKEWEVGVLVTGFFEHPIECPLHVFPESVAPGLDHHAPADGAILCQVSSADDLLIPFGIVFATGGGDRGLCAGHGMNGQGSRKFGGCRPSNDDDRTSSVSQHAV